MTSPSSADVIGRLVRVRDELLRWFGRHGRRFPWRGEVGWYGVLVAEFMLVRTRSEVAERAFREFMLEFPEPEALCSSSPQRVLDHFRKLGLPSRAERLIGTVCAVLERYGGEIPCDYGELRRLPGVGDYIARVLLSRVCGKHAAFADSNVVRILSRFSGRLLNGSEAARILEEAFTGRDLLSINVALIDLGSKVCGPRSPRCPGCPLREGCFSRLG